MVSGNAVSMVAIVVFLSTSHRETAQIKKRIKKKSRQFMNL